MVVKNFFTPTTGGYAPIPTPLATPLMLMMLCRL